MSARKSSHRTIFLIVSSGSPLALIASSLRSTSKNPFCPMTRSLHPPISACAHRVRFVGTWREEFFEAPSNQNRLSRGPSDGVHFRPLVGFLTRNALVQSGARISLTGWVKPVAEPEIAVHVAHDVAAGADR